jgi:hypothetical protein
MAGSTIARGLLVTSIALESSAFADVTGDQCIDANAKGQLLRRNGALVAARSELRNCADARCPSMVRDDCAQRLDDLERALPTIVFEGKNAAGNDILWATVLVDGHRVTDRLDGLPISVDPGPRTLEFVVADRPPITRMIVVREGEKDRIERVVFGLASEPHPPPTEPTPHAIAGVPARTTEKPTPGLGGAKISGLVVAAMGLGSLAVGAAYGFLAQSAWDRSRSECNTSNCPAPSRPQAVSDHRVAVVDSTVSTVGLVAGAALFAGGITVLLAWPPSHRSPAKSGAPRVVPAVGPSTAALDLRWEF